MTKDPITLIIAKALHEKRIGDVNAKARKVAAEIRELIAQEGREAARCKSTQIPCLKHKAEDSPADEEERCRHCLHRLTWEGPGTYDHALACDVDHEGEAWYEEWTTLVELTAHVRAIYPGAVAVTTSSYYTEDMLPRLSVEGAVDVAGAVIEFRDPEDGVDHEVEIDVLLIEIAERESELPQLGRIELQREE